jgi:sialate O-acetylesterase
MLYGEASMRTLRIAGVIILTCLFLTTLSVYSIAAVKLPEIISDSMVLQRDKPVRLWGQANPGERIKVEFAGQTKKTISDESGSWLIKLSPLAASTIPRIMTVSGENKIEVKNILVGDVWLASGQSNMAYTMSGLGGGPPSGGPPGLVASARPTRTNNTINNLQAMSTNNAPLTGGASGPPAISSTEIPERRKQELSNANYLEIRLFKVIHQGMPGESQSTARMSGWSGCNSDSLKDFSAVAYYFAKKIYQATTVPIGIIDSSIGGTAIEPWTPIEEYKNSSLFKTDIAVNSNMVDGQELGSNYNVMIKPLAPFSMRGFIWYQGETNCDRNDKRYTEKMRLLIQGWRRVWNDNDLGFYYVQLAPFTHSQFSMGKAAGLTTESLPEFWEMQAKALSTPNTGMVVTTDLVDDVNNIHPPNKWDVGYRLALIALAKSYGHKDIVYSGPHYKAMKIVGNEVYLSFDHLGGGLISRDGKPLTDFTIAGSDSTFYPADAKIVGNEVVVSSSNVNLPIAVRFAWNETSQPNLANKEGLPAVPFRTGP